MIIFKAFQGLENFYIKFQDFPYFSGICTNPDKSQFTDRVVFNNVIERLVHKVV